MCFRCFYFLLLLLLSCHYYFYFAFGLVDVLDGSRVLSTDQTNRFLSPCSICNTFSVCRYCCCCSFCIYLLLCMQSVFVFKIFKLIVNTFCTVPLTVASETYSIFRTTELLKILKFHLVESLLWMHMSRT